MVRDLRVTKKMASEEIQLESGVRHTATTTTRRDRLGSLRERPRRLRTVKKSKIPRKRICTITSEYHSANAPNRYIARIKQESRVEPDFR